MDWLALSARARGSAPAIRECERVLTYAELRDAAYEKAEELRSNAGIRTRDLVSFEISGRLEYVILLHALWKIGAIAKPVRPESTPGMNAESGTGIELDVTGHCNTSDVPEGTLVILSTSGTTGTPKSVPLTDANFHASAMASAANLGVNENDNWLDPLPLHHVGGLSVVTRSAIYATMLTLGKETELLSTSSDMPVTMVSLVPSMLRRLMDASTGFTGALNPSLRVILLGGAPADNVLLDEAVARGLPVLTSYGMTETCSQISAMRPSDPLDKLGSAGRPLDGVRVEITGTQQSGPCDSGRIRISGPMVTHGYLPSGDDTGNSPFDGSSFLTSDIGRIDEDGYLWIEGRVDDVIITGGENVFPADVEAVLRSHPAVSEAAVFGVPDRNWGEAVCCLLVLKKEAREDKGGNSNADQIEEIRYFCKSHLASHQVPKRFAIVDALPLNDAGKRHIELMRNIVTGNE